jgi:hypothetical protein
MLSRAAPPSYYDQQQHDNETKSVSMVEAAMVCVAYARLRFVCVYVCAFVPFLTPCMSISYAQCFHAHNRRLLPRWGIPTLSHHGLGNSWTGIK